MNDVLVIAFKFNDIYYALSTEESKRAARKFLLIIETPQCGSSEFPLQDRFQEVRTIVYNKTYVGLLEACLHAKRVCKGWQIDTVILSNPILVLNQFVYCLVGGKSLTWVEDGLMNYMFTSMPNSFFKKIAQFLLGVSDAGMFNTSSTTYLLQPEMASFYGGKRRQLNLSPLGIESQLTPMLSGKKIFYGQDFYPLFCTKEEYLRLVNEAVDKFDIDYYIPHLFSSPNEDIHCAKLDLANYHVTLEMVAPCVDFDLFTFGSSVIYTTKLINPAIRTHLIHVPFFDISKIELIKRCCDNIY